MMKKLMNSIIRVQKKGKAIHQLTCLMVCLLVSTKALAVKEIIESMPSDNVSNIAIDNHSGLINVVGWNKDKISVTATLDDEAKALVFEKEGAQVHISVEYPSMDSWGAEGSKMTIFMPKNIKMKASSVSSDIHLSNLHGGVEVITVSGNIVAKNISQHIELNNISGDIKSEDLHGDLSLSAVSGDINDVNSSGQLAIKSISGEVMVNSQAKEVFFNNVSGKSQLTLAKVTELRIRTVSGDLQAMLHLIDDGLVNASAVSGDLAFIFQNDINANFNLKSSVGGDISNHITQTKAVDDEYGPGSELHFKIGNTSAEVRVSTVSSNIQVNKQ